MKTIYIERSTGSGRNGSWVDDLDLNGVGRIVVGTGPGSFAGIRAALAFAQGYALGKSCEVRGLPSPCAIAALAGEPHLAVVGDARQGKLWVALFDGCSLAGDVFQVEGEEILSAVPGTCRVVSPDDVRIGTLLKEKFAERYLGEALPTAEGLRLYAEAHPTALAAEPLPIYLNPAVRTAPVRPERLAAP